MLRKLLIVFLLLNIQLVFAVDVKTYIPKNAYTYLPVLKEQQIKIWPDHPMPYVLAALVEQENCISLTSNGCWNPATKLDTSREFGGGLMQLTKAYKSDGSIRFDALQEMKNKHAELGALNWGNILVRPDLQLAAGVLKSHDDYKTLYSIKDPIARLHFTDVAYNSGMGNVNSKRRTCSLSASCDPQQWFVNVENIYNVNAKPIYGTRTAAQITKEHTENVFHVRANKYKPFFE